MARQKLGQHFLASSAVLDQIARAACPEPEPLVVEIGPGLGALTERLLDRAEHVIAIEIDTELVAYLAHRFAADPRLTVVHADVLETDLAQWGPAVIAGNLPYSVATPIIEKTLAMGDRLDRALFLVQKEVAARLAAAPGSRDYGYLSVITRLLADAKPLFDVPPSAFRPPPKVDSTVIELRPHDRAAELGITDRAGFLEFVSRSFRHKRKTLRNNLAVLYGKEIVDKWPEARLRAEQLTLEKFAELFRHLVA